jgi:hypothetical protein
VQLGNAPFPSAQPFQLGEHGSIAIGPGLFLLAQLYRLTQWQTYRKRDCAFQSGGISIDSTEQPLNV